MEWLSQNWIWLALIGGMIWMHRRGGAMGGCCGHSMAHEGPGRESKAQSADAPRSSIKEEKGAQAAENSPSSGHRGRGECC